MTMHSMTSPAPEPIPAGGFRATVRDVYRTRDGQAYFTFDFVPAGQYYEIDIVQQPDYGYRSQDFHHTHRLPSARGGLKICFGDPRVVNSLAAAYRWAQAWAEETWDYITTGNAFSNH